MFCDYGKENLGKRKEILNDLLDIWESAVRATHTFLSESDIEEIKKVVPLAIENVERLIVTGFTSKPVGFIGINGKKIEMLFIHNKYRGRGFGSELINYVLTNFHCDEVCVNEANEGAHGFYKIKDFVDVDRHELDEDGRPFPIIVMKREYYEFAASYYDSPIGKMLIVSDIEGLKGLYFVGQENYLRNIKDEIKFIDTYINNKVKKRLDNYFDHKKTDINFNMVLEGTDFERDVWRALSTVSYGETITYGELAKIVEKIFNRKNVSPRAVGRALGKNPISIILPCHRVIGQNNSLTGYAGGLERKKWLLNFEKQEPTD